ncbi:MAG: hypothetical protein WC612_03755 [Bdellovibrionales bacterium]|jgi:hypothetical protein
MSDLSPGLALTLTMATAAMAAGIFVAVDNTNNLKQNEPAIREALVDAAEKLCTRQSCPDEMIAKKNGVEVTLSGSRIIPSLEDGENGYVFSTTASNIHINGKKTSNIHVNGKKICSDSINYQFPFPKGFKFAADRPPANGSTLSSRAEATPK